VHCVVTSPPYWGLRDYGVAGQLGLEASFHDYIATMVGVFREVRRVLRKDGTLWLNMGDSFQDKQLVGMPWRLALALQADGWYLRSDIIWHKPNPMPESVTDRPTKAHEYVFLLSKSERYFYDAEEISEDANPQYESRYLSPFYVGVKETAGGGRPDGAQNTAGMKIFTGKRNKRTVWTIPTAPYSEAHFATFPPALIEPCILAGCPKGGLVLDPFGGAGTTGLVADRLGRDAILIELNPKYAAMAEDRLREDAGLFANVAAE
jgi:DNA modification methylase